MKQPIRDPAVQERMRVVFDLYESGEKMMRQNFRRQDPSATDSEIERRLLLWLRERGGEEGKNSTRSRQIPPEPAT
ncbi:MAG: hypothetical protein V3S30_06370 [Thermoanaerobaculia bacterium]